MAIRLEGGWLANLARFLCDFEYSIGGVVCTERLMALFQGSGSPVQICIKANRNAVYENFGPFNIGS